MNDNKKVTVVIPTYKRPEMMDNALRSVLAQSYEDLEIMIVDDNGKGTDAQKDTEKYIEKFKSDLRVKYLINEENSGACVSRNRGIRAAQTEYVAFLDDDDQWGETFLEEVITKFKESADAELGVVFTGFNIKDARHDRIKPANKKNFSCDDMFIKLLRGECPTSTSLCVVKKECFDATGGFDELLASFQDYDMWLRIAQKGYKFDYIDKPLITKYEGHGEQISINPDKRYKGLCRIKEKWTKVLTQEENEIFKITLEGFENQIKKNRIIYNKEKGIKCDKSLYIDYLKTNDKLSTKLKIIALIVFGKKMLKFRS